MRFVPKFLEALGAAPFIIGLYDAIKTLLGAIYAWPGGIIADRFGHRRAWSPSMSFRSSATRSCP